MSEYMLTECYTETIPVHNDSEHRRKCIFLKIVHTHENTHQAHQTKGISCSRKLKRMAK